MTILTISVAFGLGEPLEPLELVLGVFSEILGVLGVLGSGGSRGFTRSSSGFSGRPQGVPGVCLGRPRKFCGFISFILGIQAKKHTKC